MKIYLPDIHIRQTILEKDGARLRNIPPILRFGDNLYVHEHYLTGDKSADRYIKLRRDCGVFIARNLTLKLWHSDDDCGAESVVIIMDKTGKLTVIRMLNDLISTSEAISKYDELKITLANQPIPSVNQFSDNEWYWYWNFESSTPVINKESILKILHANSILDLDELYDSTCVVGHYMFMDSVYCNTDNNDPAARILIGFPDSDHMDEPIIILHNVVRCHGCGYGNNYMEIFIRTSNIDEQ